MNIEQLYEKYGPMVLRRCRQLLGNEDEAMDLTQDVFVKLLQNGQPEGVKYPSSFLYVTATNLCINRIRAQKRRGERVDDSLLHRIAVMDPTESRIGAASVLEKLFKVHEESSRTIAVLHLADGMTLEETAREMGMSVSGVRKRLARLRKTLSRIETP